MGLLAVAVAHKTGVGRALFVDCDGNGGSQDTVI
jgi:hypothetical protein